MGITIKGRKIDKELFKQPKLKRNLEIIMIGLLVLAAGIFYYYSYTGTYKRTEAIISSIEYVSESRLELTEPKIYVDFNADGIEYTGVCIDSYEPKMMLGDKLTIEYSISEPEKVRTKSKLKEAYALMAFGLCICAAGGVYLIKDISEADD